MSPRCCRRCLRSQAAKANRKRDVDPGDSHSFLGPATKKATTSMGMVYKLIYKKYPEKKMKNGDDLGLVTKLDESQLFS